MAPSERGWEMIRIVTALTALATIALIFRILARHKRRMAFGTDDLLCLIATILMYAMLVELILCEYALP